MNKKSKNPDQYSQDFVDAYNKDEDSRRIIDAALAIEGLTRGEGVHACAVLITPTPVNDHVPTKLDTKGGVEITQYEGHSVADMGLLKMDFLGLRTLTVISKALKNIRANYPTPADIERMPPAVRATIKPGATCVDIDVDKIPFDDPAIFALMGRGHTAGVFQIESAGMTSTIKGMQPREYKQVVALIALYRPGPLGAGMVDLYINRMNGKEEIAFYDERLQDILSETYGTIVYQEQVMQISVAMCGFSKGESDSRVRKPVAKKKIKLLTSTEFHWEDGRDETTYDHWMNGAVRNGYSREIAQKIWDDVLEFASYAFNKSHSAGYAILVMQTAWLKAYFPKEYMASVLTSYMGKTDKITHYISACRHEGINILPPDINESGKDFTAVPEGIRIGFAGIRGVGEGVGEAIMAERQKGGPFKSLYDFCERVDGTQANRRVISALIKAGAFDSTGYTRMQLMRFIDENNPENIIDASVRRQKERAVGQLSMFDLFSDVAGFSTDIPAPDGIEWDRNLKLAFEHEMLGIYVSDHPLRPYEYALAKARDFTMGDIEASEEVPDPATGATRTRYKVPEGRSIRLAGMVTGLSKKNTKNGEPMAVFTLGRDRRDHRQRLREGLGQARALRPRRPVHLQQHRAARPLRRGQPCQGHRDQHPRAHALPHAHGRARGHVRTLPRHGPRRAARGGLVGRDHAHGAAQPRRCPQHGAACRDRRPLRAPRHRPRGVGGFRRPVCGTAALPVRTDSRYDYPQEGDDPRERG